MIGQRASTRTSQDTNTISITNLDIVLQAVGDVHLGLTGREVAWDSSSLYFGHGYLDCSGDCCCCCCYCGRVSEMMIMIDDNVDDGDGGRRRR